MCNSALGTPPPLGPPKSTGPSPDSSDATSTSPLKFAGPTSTTDRLAAWSKGPPFGIPQATSWSAQSITGEPTTPDERPEERFDLDRRLDLDRCLDMVGLALAKNPSST
ncbi:hypothetical protein FI667_g13406, partial [Globisporangium splendens]